MYKETHKFNTSLDFNESVEGETIEEKMQRILNNKEPIKDGAPLIYTERNMGVQAGYNIRTDRFEIALDATEKIHKSNTAKREERGQKMQEKDGEAESTQGTENQ